MKKYLRYEFKKNLWTLVILTAVCVFLYLPELMSIKMVYVSEGKGEEMISYVQPCGIESSMLYLTMLCFIVPILTYSFKMSKRSVDAYYSLPLKREKLFLAKTIIGLVLVLLPFTISYWSGFFVILCRKGNPYDMIWYLPAYLGAIVLAVLLFGINAFLYTRANKVLDGIVFMLGFALMGSLIVDFIDVYLDLFVCWWGSETFPTYGALLVFGEEMGALIINETSNLSVWAFVYITIIGIVGYVFLFYCLRYEKAENAEQISDNIIGYRTLIVTYAAILIGSGGFYFINIAMVAVYEIVATIIYQRKFRIQKKEWLRILLGIVLGALFSVLANIF